MLVERMEQEIIMIWEKYIRKWEKNSIWSMHYVHFTKGQKKR